MLISTVSEIEMLPYPSWPGANNSNFFDGMFQRVVRGIDLGFNKMIWLPKSLSTIDKFFHGHNQV
jgi:hypothetical protein